MWYLTAELFYRHFGVIITLTLQYGAALEVETKYSYTYLKGILTFISSAYLPRTSQGACSFTKMMSLFVREDCKRETKQPPELTFSSKKKKETVVSGQCDVSQSLILEMLYRYFVNPFFFCCPESHV